MKDGVKDFGLGCDFDNGRFPRFVGREAGGTIGQGVDVVDFRGGDRETAQRVSTWHSDLHRIDVEIQRGFHFAADRLGCEEEGEDVGGGDRPNDDDPRFNRD